MIVEFRDVSYMRNMFIEMYKVKDFNEAGLLEIINASFIANEDSIFGTVNRNFADRERAWYLTLSKSIFDFKAPPEQWLNVSGEGGEINSNYGWAVFSRENHRQYYHAIKQLKRDPATKRSCMIYNRPSMQLEYNEYGKNDFICTWSVQLFIRESTLYYCVNMRSNDVIWGYRNDLYWHKWMYEKVYLELLNEYCNLKRHDILWFANTLHIYPWHFHYVGEYIDNTSRN